MGKISLILRFLKTEMWPGHTFIFKKIWNFCHLTITIIHCTWTCLLWTPLASVLIIEVHVHVCILYIYTKATCTCTCAFGTPESVLIIEYVSLFQGVLIRERFHCILVIYKYIWGYSIMGTIGTQVVYKCCHMDIIILIRTYLRKCSN